MLRHTRSSSPGRRALTAAVAVTAAVTGALAVPTSVSATPQIGTSVRAASGRSCPPDGLALGYSDALDKLTVGGATLGGLSDIAYDARGHAYVSSVDNDGTNPARLWFYRNLGSPDVVRAPLVLRQADGTAYTGATADNEGLAVLPDGDYLVSSETEPSIRIFGRDGVQKSQLPVPARFRVAPAGQATANATLEGLTISPDGQQIVAAMEGTLSGDISATGDDTFRRLLVYRRDGAGNYHLSKQIGYQVQPGNRISEVQSYARGRLLVMEAAYSPATGNSVELYAVTSVASAPNVATVANLSQAPADVVTKQLAVDVTACPSLGAPAKETQANPLMDNFEGMTVRATRLPTGGGYLAQISLISDDNFSPTQTTRIVNLAAVLP
jgi:hypothetical protein